MDLGQDLGGSAGGSAARTTRARRMAAPEYEDTKAALVQRYLSPLERVLSGSLLDSTRPELLRLRSRLEHAKAVLLEPPGAAPSLTVAQLLELQSDLAANPLLGSAPPTTVPVRPMQPPSALARADSKMLVTGAALLKQMQEAGAAKASTEPCGRVLIRSGAAKEQHLRGCAICRAAAAAAATDANDAGMDGDKSLVISQLQRILYSFGDAANPPRASARAALDFVLQWQRAAVGSGAMVRLGRLSLPALQAAFPLEWREFDLAEHGRRVRDAALDDEAAAAESLDSPVDQAADPEAPADGGGASAAREGSACTPESIIEQRRRFADVRTLAMSLKEYEEYVSHRETGLSNGAFLRLSARHLQGLVADWAGFERRANNSLLRSRHGGSPDKRAVHFFLKLSLCRVADLVERANQLTHGGALCRTHAPLPIESYQEATRELLAAAAATMAQLPAALPVAAAMHPPSAPLPPSAPQPPSALLPLSAPPLPSAHLPLAASVPLPLAQKRLYMHTAKVDSPTPLEKAQRQRTAAAELGLSMRWGSED